LITLAYLVLFFNCIYFQCSEINFFALPPLTNEKVEFYKKQASQSCIIGIDVDFQNNDFSVLINQISDTSLFLHQSCNGNIYIMSFEQGFCNLCALYQKNEGNCFLTQKSETSFSFFYKNFSENNKSNEFPFINDNDQINLDEDRSSDINNYMKNLYYNTKKQNSFDISFFNDLLQINYQKKKNEDLRDTVPDNSISSDTINNSEDNSFRNFQVTPDHQDWEKPENFPINFKIQPNSLEMCTSRLTSLDAEKIFMFKRIPNDSRSGYFQTITCTNGDCNSFSRKLFYLIINQFIIGKNNFSNITGSITTYGSGYGEGELRIIHDLIQHNNFQLKCLYYIEEHERVQNAHYLTLFSFLYRLSLKIKKEKNINIENYEEKNHCDTSQNKTNNQNSTSNEDSKKKIKKSSGQQKNRNNLKKTTTSWKNIFKFFVLPSIFILFLPKIISFIKTKNAHQ